MNLNREIYNREYSDANLRIAPRNPYEAGIIELRRGYVEENSPGRDVLDLCCGTGAYLIPVLGRVKSAAGVDFSSTMLDGFVKNLGSKIPENLSLIEADAATLPLADECVDFVFSFTSLYYVPEVEKAVEGAARVLRPGGRAVLEMGNSTSINAWFSNWQHKNKGWARDFSVPLPRLLAVARGAGLRTIRSHAFQLLPMYEAPKRLFWMYPLLSPAWKRLMGLRAGSRMLDDVVCSMPGLRRFAFRHILVMEKI